MEHEWLGVWISVVLDAVELALEDREDDRTADDEQQDDQADGGGSVVEEANDRQPPETNLAGLCDFGDDQIFCRGRPPELDLRC